MRVMRMRSRQEALTLRDLISSWVRMCTGVRIPGFIMRFPVRRESAVPPILSRDVPRDWPGGRPFGWGKFFSLCTVCLVVALRWGMPLGWVPHLGCRVCWAPISPLGGSYGRRYALAVEWASFSQGRRVDVRIETTEFPKWWWGDRNEPG